MFRWLLKLLSCTTQCHVMAWWRQASSHYMKRKCWHWNTGSNRAWWRHQMETFSALLIVRGIHRSPVNSPHKGQWRGALMFPLIYALTNGRANNRDAVYLRRHWAHYDVTVMEHIQLMSAYRTWLYQHRFPSGRHIFCGGRNNWYNMANELPLNL